ncbi:MAG: zf-HC2 domain-containing protein [Actinobacteria bacterium]|nr:zf-HC2 domain-containing protein [Actinomycetota bacterium]
MIAALRNPLGRRGHPRPELLSRHIDGELEPRERLALEAHLRDCPRCRELLASLSETVSELGSLRRTEEQPDLADSIIAALRAESPPSAGARRPSSQGSRPALLTVVRGDGPPPTVEPAAAGRAAWLRTALRDCVRLAQLRFTVPLAILLGVALSLINQGGMIFDEGLTLTTCAMCAPNFIAPFIALNVGAALAIGARKRRGF